MKHNFSFLDKLLEFVHIYLGYYMDQTTASVTSLFFNHFYQFLTLLNVPTYDTVQLGPIS